LPVSALGADITVVTGLRRAGLKTIGEVAARERHEITARFGAAFTALLEQALGYSDAPISPRKPLPDYIVEKRFAEPVVTEAVISATLSGLAGMLVTAMAKQGKGARRLEACFFRTDGAVRTLMVDTGQPVTRGEVIDRLFRERLETLSDPLDPGFGFDLIRLAASRTEIVVQQQRDLDANVHDNDELAALIDRIAARIGGKRVAVHGAASSAGRCACDLASAHGGRAAAAAVAAVRTAGTDQGDRRGAGWSTGAVRLAPRYPCRGSYRRSRTRRHGMVAGGKRDADARLFSCRGRGRLALLALSRRVI
jgi:protein ImuB